ncbi:hypothetical protein MTO96_016040 [Rhipicephalus appendiculatus]
MQPRPGANVRYMVLAEANMHVPEGPDDDGIATFTDDLAALTEDESHEDNRCPTSLSSGAECETEDAPAAFDSSPNAYADSASKARTQERTQPTQRSQPVPDGRPRSRYGRILKAPERLAM